MSFFRRLITLLLMVTLPAYAWAALGVQDACPMQGMPMAEAGHACCEPAKDDHGQPDKHQPCKAGQECKTGSLYQPQFPRTEQAFVPTATIVLAGDSPVLTRAPTGVWRPPRSC